MDIAQIWKSCFENWPEELPRRGVLVTGTNEQIPFITFLSSPDMLLIERTTPDTVGTRRALIPYGNIFMIKITDVVKEKDFSPLGFGASPAKKTKPEASLSTAT
jgi:hypothetical protein